VVEVTGVVAAVGPLEGVVVAPAGPLEGDVVVVVGPLEGVVEVGGAFVGIGAREIFAGVE
jgi:hypothetical protein